MANEDQFGGSDAKFDKLAVQLLEEVTSNAATWNIDPLVIDIGQGYLDIWTKKYAITKKKTKSSEVDRENTAKARVNLTKWLRKFVKTNIYENDLMDDGAISSTGLKPHKTTKTKIGKPETVPSVEMKAGNPPNVKSHYRQQPDAAGVKKSGKPDGVARVETAIFICMPLPPDDKGVIKFTTPPANPDNYGRFDSGTRTPMTLKFDPELSGLFFYSCSCWVTATGIKGDWSAPQKFRIP